MVVDIPPNHILQSDLPLLGDRLHPALVDDLDDAFMVTLVLVH
jgi:hypothetical protein